MTDYPQPDIEACMDNHGYETEQQAIEHLEGCIDAEEYGAAIGTHRLEGDSFVRVREVEHA